jgi:hypothetical protein
MVEGSGLVFAGAETLNCAGLIRKSFDWVSLELEMIKWI